MKYKFIYELSLGCLGTEILKILLEYLCSMSQESDWENWTYIVIEYADNQSNLTKYPDL